MRPYTIMGAALCLLACGEARKPSLAYDPDTSDAWRFSVDTVQGEMDVRPKISHHLMTFGEWRMPLQDSSIANMLEFSCEDHKLSGFMAASEYVDEDRKARIRLDSQPPFVANALVFNTSNEGFVWFQNPAAMVRQLVNAREFRVEFTPRGGIPVVARFNVRGLESHLPALLRPCGLIP